ncbi:NAD(P)H-dependent oxidoreductase [Ralstonia insidiosa]|jgi:FMN-dependent NADH-azoreductase|uniref:FMN-dependent NADH-azoreductase n=3 Tax=Pseudomonadota TaxID=1224 RepID=UPI000664AC91|nr:MULTISPECIES: NAD(P)H-dependent oxidoreductase [Ralstonia]KMW45276.1 FMN-dependent NADH-azoreductase [Ralstonia sp. MD27]MBX3774470.1 NAD(P)H-dependent oxidoreductase [Ralstonia pickettii]MBA9859040.1 FMN-dependent NADH-azoreductase [Ralstonia insidiosa]MBA9873524.1 FMN-dependent NADH-azoreductase [Ralstonia insidiosa]MBA9915335.1 FMN-dependent NADH-azoreductase [Ralstonia insidiosa]
MNILQINSSARPYANGEGSQSTRLATELVRGLEEASPGAVVVVRDLGQTPPPLVDGAALQALHTPAEHRSPEQRDRVAADDALIAEVLAADVIVLGVPMYNFSIPAQLKAWIDAICRAGVTFSYGAQGPVGLLRNKTVYAVLSRGGVHRDQPTDVIAPYLKVTLGFLGMTDVRFVYAEGLAMGPDMATRSIADAQAQIQNYVEDFAAV